MPSPTPALLPRHLCLLAMIGFCMLAGVSHPEAFTGEVNVTNHSNVMQASSFINDITLPSMSAHHYDALINIQRQDEISTLKQMAPAFTAAGVTKAKQKEPLADNAWIKASGYDFHSRTLTQQGIDILEGFSSLPKNILSDNMAGTVVINHSANASAQEHAVADAFDIPYMHFLAEALGPHMGNIFLKAYQSGKLDKTAALIKASELSTGAAKDYFNYTRPFLIKGNQVHLVPDRWIVKDGTPYSANKGSFPSGHTVTGQTDAILLAEMLPERFPELIARGDGYGYSRLILGVHYPLDVIASRMHVEMVLSHYLNDPAYMKLFNQARSQLRTVLRQECGESLAACAKPGSATDDPWASAAARSFHHYTLNYGFPAVGSRHRVMQVPVGAEALLSGPFPHMSAEQRRRILAHTAIPSGDPLDQPNNDWQRIDLLAAYELGKRVAK